MSNRRSPQPLPGRAPPFPTHCLPQGHQCRQHRVGTRATPLPQSQEPDHPRRAAAHCAWLGLPAGTPQLCEGKLPCPGPAGSSLDSSQHAEGLPVPTAASVRVRHRLVEQHALRVVCPPPVS